MQPSDIKQLTFVPVVTLSSDSDSFHLNEKAESGYQRAGERARMQKIAQFVANRPDCIIPPVLLSCRGRWKFTAATKNGRVGRLEAESLAAIIDGQHRLGGLWRIAQDDTLPESTRSRPIPFMAIDDMTLEDEKQEFVDINGTQKGVKKSLLKYLDRHKTFAGRAATALMEDEESVFKGRIDEQRKNDWTLFLFGAAVECVDLMFGDSLIPLDFNPRKDESVQESAIEFTLRYWRFVSECLDKYWSDIDHMPPVGTKKTKERRGTGAFQYRLLEETGIRAFSQLASDLFAITWIEHARSPSWDTLRDYLVGLSESETVATVLSKPKGENKERVLALNPELKSTGKAGVRVMYIYLKGELNKVVQGGQRSR
jgi:DGQHR domain-containing protein